MAHPDVTVANQVLMSPPTARGTQQVHLVQTVRQHRFTQYVPASERQAPQQYAALIPDESALFLEGTWRRQCSASEATVAPKITVDARAGASGKARPGLLMPSWQPDVRLYPLTVLHNGAWMLFAQALGCPKLPAHCTDPGCPAGGYQERLRTWTRWGTARAGRAAHSGWVCCQFAMLYASLSSSSSSSDPMKSSSSSEYIPQLGSS